MGIVYFVIALFSTIAGAAAGLGGGVIIKPVLDALGDYNLFVIGVLSSATVFSMALVSVGCDSLAKVKPDRKLIALTIGAVIGGFIGNEVFSSSARLAGDTVLGAIQIVIMIILLSVALLKSKLPHFYIRNMAAVLLTGTVLGGLSAFLGIGGGPVNVAVLYMLFSMDIKEAATGSIFIILFSQLTKLIIISGTTGFGAYDYGILFWMIPAGMLGGLIGFWLKLKLEHKHVEWMYYTVVLGVIALNVYNFIKIFV